MVFATSLFVTGMSANAYESDFHYGLTYWLAARAGFSALQSHDLARGNERTDTGMLDAKHAMVWELCIGGNEVASELTREFHFRSQVRAPAPPSKRRVDSSAPFAGAAVKSVMTEVGTEERDQLVRFGRALHGWQDSFAHRGVPADLPICPSEWSWAHPRDRDGPATHDADLTFLYDEDCLEAARTTYEALIAYRRKQNLPVTSPDWKTLKPKAGAFCKAATKTDKAQWLADEGVPQPRAIAKNTNLKAGAKSFFDAPLMNLGETLPTAADANATIPMYEVQAMRAERDPEANRMVQFVLVRLTAVQATPDVQNWFEAFFRTWLSTPVPQLAQALSPFFGPGVQMQITSPSIDALLRLRIADRGEARAVGSAMFQVLSQPDSVVTVAPDDWQTFLVPVRGRDQAVLVGNPRNDGKNFVAIAVLRHAPYDVLMVTAARDEDSFRIRAVNSFVFH
jgi:hypothetical protein